jgi:hypothetical protein
MESELCGVRVDFEKMKGTLCKCATHKSCDRRFSI